ncbi:MAG TPA: hypothetical protein VFX59_18070 [Polyangiales bacterium]|nr:hypothetical protein [Polyangiales bacterium]
MSVLRRTLLVSLLATVSCESGPTSEWPAKGDPTPSDNDDEGSSARDAATSPNLDAGTPTTVLDAGRAAEEPCDSDAGDAGCSARDQ